MADLAKELKEKEGVNPFVIPEGGAAPLGSFGYIDATQEIME